MTILQVLDPLKLLSSLKESSYLTLWHGGNLDKASSSKAKPVGTASSRQEYGPGLYLTTHYSTATKYAKGSRKLYRIKLKKGTDANKVKLPYSNVVDFLSNTVPKAKVKRAIPYFEKHRNSGIPVISIINLSVEEKWFSPSTSGLFRQFLVDSGVDYLIVDNAFGWGERMIVLFNMELILSSEVVRSSEKLSTFDLPTEFVEE